jgi:hypothetical protein
MRASDIIRKSDRKSIERARTQPLHARLYKVEDNKVLYTVNSSKQDKQYIVTIQLLNLTGNKLRSLRSALNGDLKISCSCPGFLYRGFKYITWHANSGINKETRSPDKTNPNKEGMACKHILVALNKLKSDYTAIYNMFKAQVLHGNSKPNQSDVKDNNKSTTPTDYDIKLLTDFKDACSKLYSDYTKYQKNGTDGDFADSSFFDGNDPTTMLQNLSIPVTKSIKDKFIGRLNSLQSVINLMQQKRNSFNILLDSDVSTLIKKINANLNSKTESYINNVILTLMYS